VHQHEGEGYTLETEDGQEETRPYEELGSSVTLTHDEIRTLSLQAILERLLTMGEELAHDTEELAHARIGEWTEAAGTAVSNEGRPLSAEALLAMLEEVQIEFDETGDFSEGTVFVLPPDLMSALPAELERMDTEPDLKAQWLDLKRRKYEEWRDRESHRSLVD
ncbi:hypothetical protein CMK11_11825, partial [Candidatus Poribacteria bacterium]|nr:hypothetical protein [Candidatus Poribacteria bacterium]